MGRRVPFSTVCVASIALVSLDAWAFPEPGETAPYHADTAQPHLDQTLPPGAEASSRILRRERGMRQDEVTHGESFLSSPGLVDTSGTRSSPKARREGSAEMVAAAAAEKAAALKAEAKAAEKEAEAAREKADALAAEAAKAEQGGMYQKALHAAEISASKANFKPDGLTEEQRMCADDKHSGRQVPGADKLESCQEMMFLSRQSRTNQCWDRQDGLLLRKSCQRTCSCCCGDQEGSGTHDTNGIEVTCAQLQKWTTLYRYDYCADPTYGASIREKCQGLCCTCSKSLLWLANWVYTNGSSTDPRGVEGKPLGRLTDDINEARRLVSQLAQTADVINTTLPTLGELVVGGQRRHRHTMKVSNEQEHGADLYLGGKPDDLGDEHGLHSVHVASGRGGQALADENEDTGDVRLGFHVPSPTSLQNSTTEWDWDKHQDAEAHFGRGNGDAHSLDAGTVLKRAQKAKAKET